ncbi:hypothetical protein OH492_09075 [Vibrio chagasii]|nr:hypothetical protein [Vibrio chagasii]
MLAEGFSEEQVAIIEADVLLSSASCSTISFHSLNFSWCRTKAAAANLTPVTI